MGRFNIEGGNPLRGRIAVSGAKNAATKIMLASLLTEEACRFEDIPRLGDTAVAEELLNAVGAQTQWSGNTFSVSTPDVRSARVLTLSRRNRLPILALGPLLHRAGEVEVPIVGGDAIGPRPVDFHLLALRSMGAEVSVEGQAYRARAKGLRGADLTLAYPSVGATENILFAAVLADGVTTIRNAAMEPEILDLIVVLQKMGAIVEFGANRFIRIDGVKRLHGVTHTVMPDRNEAVSFAAMALATAGDLTVVGAQQLNLITFLNTVRRMGGEYEVLEDGIRFFRPNALRAVAVETDTHPGFMTDWQQPLAVVLTQAEGTSTIHETVYEDRMGYLEDLRRMGADATVLASCLGGVSCRFSNRNIPHSATIVGPHPLHGTEVTVRDIRAGIAQVIAALAAEGQSTIHGIEHIDRGYENIDERLRGVGAAVSRKD